VAAQGAVSAALARDDRAYEVRPSGSGFATQNPVQRPNARFDRSGVVVAARGGRLGLRLAGAGYGSALHPVGGAAPRAAGDRVAFARGNLAEWYVNGPLGLEQGFTIANALAGQVAGPLTLSLALSGNTRASLAEDGKSVTLERGGKTVLRYTGLRATDARGRSLRAWLELQGGRLLLHLDARGACYPLRIDPFVQQDGAPVVEMRPPSSITGTSATLNAIVNPNGETVSDCHFEYGTSTSYESSVPCLTLPGSGTSSVQVSAEVTGLSRGVRYDFRIVATNPSGTSVSGDEEIEPSEPEFGRCVKLAKGAEGKFATSNCKSLATHEKHAFEWMPGPGPKPKFTTVSKGELALIPHLAGRTTICTGEPNGGEYTGPKTVASVVLTFTGCEMKGSVCTSAGEEQGHVVTNTLEGVLVIVERGFLEHTPRSIALDLIPVEKAGPFMEFSCGAEAVVVDGSVLGQEKPNISLSVMPFPKFLTKHSNQRPSKFEGSPREVLHCPFGKSTEQCGLKLEMVQTNEEKMEINSVL
jgi:hypothetical protein